MRRWGQFGDAMTTETREHTERELFVSHGVSNADWIGKRERRFNWRMFRFEIGRWHYRTDCMGKTLARRWVPLTDEKSVTTIIDSPRALILQTQHDIDVLSDRVNALVRGARVRLKGNSTLAADFVILRISFLDRPGYRVKVARLDSPNAWAGSYPLDAIEFIA